MTTRGYREVDWSGDVAVQAWGATRAEMVEEVTRGLLGLMAWKAPAPVLERPVTVSARDAGELLVDWLSAVIRLAATHGEVYGEVRVEHADANGAHGVIRGAPAAEGELRCDVKAATYHGLLVEERGGRHHCRVVFDL